MSDDASREAAVNRALSKIRGVLADPKASERSQLIRIANIVTLFNDAIFPWGSEAGDD